MNQQGEGKEEGKLLPAVLQAIYELKGGLGRHAGWPGPDAGVPAKVLVRQEGWTRMDRVIRLVVRWQAFLIGN
ncbi:hypothetical protein J1614_001861 [Plenodomus biglobosus]|nr:hypothetical protein J1614_001861 [Plenodomus biglobosus]